MRTGRPSEVAGKTLSVTVAHDLHCPTPPCGGQRPLERGPRANSRRALALHGARAHPPAAGWLPGLQRGSLDRDTNIKIIYKLNVSFCVLFLTNNSEFRPSWPDS